MAKRITTHGLYTSESGPQTVMVQPGAKFVRATATDHAKGLVNIHHLAETDVDQVPVYYMLASPGYRIPNGYDYCDTVNVNGAIYHIYGETRPGSLQEAPKVEIGIEGVVANAVPEKKYHYEVQSSGPGSTFDRVKFDGTCPAEALTILLERFTTLNPADVGKFLARLEEVGNNYFGTNERGNDYTLTVYKMEKWEGILRNNAAAREARLAAADKADPNSELYR